MTWCLLEKDFSFTRSLCIFFSILSGVFFNLQLRSDSRFDEGTSISIIRVCVFCGAISFREKGTIWIHQPTSCRRSLLVSSTEFDLASIKLSVNFLQNPNVANFSFWRNKIANDIICIFPECRIVGRDNKFHCYANRRQFLERCQGAQFITNSCRVVVEYSLFTCVATRNEVVHYTVDKTSFSLSVKKRETCWSCASLVVRRLARLIP